MLDFFAVGIGGFIGSCARFAITKAANGLTLEFPFGTLISNVTAGLIIGLILGLEEQALVFSPKNKLFITTGLLGGLSTFSTFSLETVNLFAAGKYFLTFGNIVLNLSLSLLGVVAGVAIAKLVLRKV